MWEVGQMASSERIERIGFVGVGRMGRPMASNLLEHGFAVAAYDLNPAPVAALAEMGARAASSAADAARDAQAVISMVPGPADASALWLGTQGLLAALEDGAVAIDMSSIDPLTSRTVHEAARSRGIEMLDAPVSGGVEGATSGRLAIMVGGDPALFERCRPVFRAMGREEALYHVGGPGHGCAMKMCNNVLTGINMVAACEAIALGIRSGLDVEMLYKVITQSSGTSSSLERRIPKVMAADFEPGFALDHMYKDIGIAVDTAALLNTPLYFGALARQRYAEARRAGYGGEDSSAVAKIVERGSGVSLRPGGEAPSGA
jgi:3-hydroxyisobutyrate dehydrogenase